MFIFYDIEATGLNREFCQILQMAFVATDNDLNPVHAKDISARCNPWTIPSPGALLITGFTPDDLKKPPASHFDMMHEVDGWLRAKPWPATFIGYNIMGFDEDVFRQALHQTLHDPYLTIGRKEAAAPPNTRADLLKIVKAVAVYAPGTIKLDVKNEFGTPSFSLGNITRQNGVGLSEEDAHDAMADTKATLALAKLIKTAAPAIWDHMMTLTSKEGVEDFFDQNKVFAFTDYAYGKADNRLMTALFPFNGTQNVMCDLTRDPALLMSKSVDELAEIFKAKGEERFGQPLRTVSRNKHPVLMPLDMADPVRPPDLDDATLNQRANALRNNPEFIARVKAAVAIAYPPMTPGKEPEQKIYDFAPSEARGDLNRWMRQFREGDWEQRVTLINDFPKRFESSIKKQPALTRFMNFAERIVFADAPDKMSDDQRKKMAGFIASRALDASPDAPYMTIARARLEMDGIEAERAAGIEKWQHATDEQIKTLKDYYTALERDIRKAAGLPEMPLASGLDAPVTKRPDDDGPKPAQPPIWR